MPPVVLTGRVRWAEGRYVASVDGLNLEAQGETTREAQDGLINLLRNWIEVQDGRSALEETLAQAGFPGVAEDTDLHLEFVE